MKTLHKFLSLLLALSLLALGAAAQTAGNYKTAGSVADSAAKQPLSFVTISLATTTGDPVKSTLTDDKGKFVLANLRMGKYQLSITAVGYKKMSMPVVIGNDAKTANLGLLLLAADARALKEVNIQGHKALVQQKPDRIVYDMQADPESKAKSVLEMLRKVPFVTVDANNTINLKGSTNFKVYVNGRPSGALQNNLTEVLKGMPASSIVRIEVITVPSSRYDAEGSGGIINIVTNKKMGDGYRGSVNVFSRVPDGSTGSGGSFTLRAGKLGVNAYGGGSYYNSPRTTFSNAQQSTGDTITSLQQNGSRRNDGRSGYGGVELSYDIDTLHLLSGTLNVNGNHGNGSSFQTSALFDNAGLATQTYDITNHNLNTSKGMDASLNYQIGSQSDKDRLITLSYQFSGYRNYSFANLDMANELNYDVPDHQQLNNQKVAEHTLQADYAKKIGKVNVDAGLKAIFRNDQSDYQYLNFDSASDAFNLDSAMSNRFNYRQNVYGAYAMAQFSLKKWNFNAGLRAEQTHVDAEFLTTESFARQNYLNVIPFVAINRPLDNGATFNITYTQRVRRPSVYRLNPFVDRSNPNFVSTGNPNLKTVPMNDLQLSYNIDNGKGFSIFTAADFIYVKNLDLPITVFDPATNITTSTYQNIGTGGGVTWVLNINYSPAKAYRIGLNSNTTILHVDGRPGVAADRLRAVNPNVFLSNNYQFADGWNASANFEYHGPNPASLQGRIKSFFSTSFSVNKELVKNKFFVSASIDNPISRYRYQVINTYGPNFYQHSVNQSNFRAFGLSATYNFGRLKDGVKKSRKEINNDDSFGSKGN